MGDVSAIGGAGPGISHVADLATQRAAGRSHVVNTDHGEEQFVGDANRQEQVHVDAGVGELAEGLRARLALPGCRGSGHAGKLD
jgi:hypothetical protein